MATYFTSDTHFGHANIIKYCARPFLDLHAMHREMTQRWNAVVQPFDTVYHLGDFAFGNASKIAEYRKKLNGKIVLVLGNHDRGAPTMREAGFETLQWAYLNTLIPGQTVFLRHHPKFPWPAEAGIHLCGHVHEKWKRRGNVINVGVDQWDFTPRTIEELLAAKDEGPGPDETEALARG